MVRPFKLEGHLRPKMGVSSLQIGFSLRLWKRNNLLESLKSRTPLWRLGIHGFTGELIPPRILINLKKLGLLKFAQSEQVKRLVVDLLRKAADSTETTVDNEMVDFVERGLFGELA